MRSGGTRRLPRHGRRSDKQVLPSRGMTNRLVYAALYSHVHCVFWRWVLPVGKASLPRVRLLSSRMASRLTHLLHRRCMTGSCSDCVEQVLSSRWHDQCLVYAASDYHLHCAFGDGSGQWVEYLFVAISKSSLRTASRLDCSLHASEKHGDSLLGMSIR